MAEITKKDFMEQLIEKHNYTKSSAKSLVDDFWALIEDNIKLGNSVFFHGYGTFCPVERAARECINPRTGERTKVPTHWVVRFFPGNTMKRAVKEWADDHKRGLV